MAAETKDIFEEIASDTDPVLREFIDRASKENIVDLYVEYYNQLADLEYQSHCDAKEKEYLKLFEKQCVRMIIQRALQENGYDTRMVLKYVKKNK